LIIQVVHPLIKNVVFKVSIEVSSIPTWCTVNWMAVVHVHVEIKTYGSVSCGPRKRGMHAQREYSNTKNKVQFNAHS